MRLPLILSILGAALQAQSTLPFDELKTNSGVLKITVPLWEG
jgi:hypothetical protein